MTGRQYFCSGRLRQFYDHVGINECLTGENPFPVDGNETFSAGSVAAADGVEGKTFSAQNLQKVSAVRDCQRGQIGKKGNPSIPNFILSHSPSIFLDFQGVSAFGVLAVTPFLHHFRIWLYWISSDYTILLKLLDGIIQRFGSHMNMPIHRCFYTCVTKQLLKNLGLHTAFNRSCSIGMPLRYNYDKPEKPRISRVFGYPARFFILFQTGKSSREVMIF